MPIDFPDLESLKRYFNRPKAVPFVGQTEEVYRDQCAVWSEDSGDSVQAMEVRTGSGWNKWGPMERNEFLLNLLVKKEEKKE